MRAGPLNGWLQLCERIRVRLWLLAYHLEDRREAASREQRNLACAGYCLLLAVLGSLGSRR